MAGPALDLDKSGSITRQVITRGPSIGPTFDLTNTVSANDFGADPYGNQDSAPAINKCLSFGMDVTLVPGTYLIKSQLTQGNGASGVASTLSPARLIGLTSGSLPLYGNPAASGVTLVWGGPANGTMLQVAGPLQGWGVENIAFDGGGIAGICLDVISAQYGQTKNLSFKGWTNIAWRNTCWPARPSGWGQVDTLHNTHIGQFFILPSVTNAIGLVCTGNAAILDNTSYCTWIDTTFWNPAALGSTITDLYLQSCDSNRFIGMHMIGGDTFTICVKFDYTFDPASHFPNSNFFFDIDASGSAAPPIRFSNAGSPVGTFPNMIFGLNETNGVTDANATIAGLSWIGTQSMVVGSFNTSTGTFSNWTPTYSSTAGTIGTTTTNFARFAQIGKLIEFYLDVSITSAGTTPSGEMLVTPPVTIKNQFSGGTGFGQFRNGATISAVTGFVFGTSNQIRLTRFDGDATSIFTNGNRIIVSGIYEAA